MRSTSDKVCQACGLVKREAAGCTSRRLTNFDTGVELDRIRWGDEGDTWDPADADGRCPMCATSPGHYHHAHCLTERCPYCSGGLFDCLCDVGDAVAGQNDDYSLPFGPPPFWAAMEAWEDATLGVLGAGARLAAKDQSEEVRTTEITRTVEAIKCELVDHISADPSRRVMEHAALGLHALAAVLERVADEIDAGT